MHYDKCEFCEEIYHEDSIKEICFKGGNNIYFVCNHCINKYDNVLIDVDDKNDNEYNLSKNDIENFEAVNYILIPDPEFLESFIEIKKEALKQVKDEITDLKDIIL